MNVLRVVLRNRGLPSSKPFKLLGVPKSNLSKPICIFSTDKWIHLTATVQYADTSSTGDPGKVKHFKEIQKSEFIGPSEFKHFKAAANLQKDGAYTLPHPIWDDKTLHSVEITHKPPDGIVDQIAYRQIQLLVKVFDYFSGFTCGTRNEKKWFTRICFLETIAGVPGMVAAMSRHLRSLRLLKRDHGWIHTLLEEAENERMHLLTALKMYNPSAVFRLVVIGAQGFFVTWFALCYIISPRFCHRFVGYLEEEAVKTYTKLLQDIENGPMQEWKTKAAPDVAIQYWQLKEKASMKDVILAIRADEALHRIVNHTLASMKRDEVNPYMPGDHTQSRRYY